MTAIELASSRPDLEGTDRNQRKEHPPMSDMTTEALVDSFIAQPPTNGKAARRPLADLLDDEVAKYTANQTAAETEANRLRADNTTRDRKITKALADIETWKQETAEDSALAKLADLAADSAKRQLAELARAKGRIAK